MKLTSFLLVINESTTDVSNLLDNIKYAGSRVQLLVFNNFCYNTKIINQLKEIASIWIDNSTPFVQNFSECVNELLRLANGEFICVAREDALICSDWLSTLIETHTLVLNSGVISVNDFSTTEGNYQLTVFDDMHWVYNKDFRINNFAFFRKDLIYKIGGFDTKLNGVYAFWDFCDRAMAVGFYNYFVPKTSMIRESLYLDHFTEPTPKEFKNRKISDFVSVFKLTPKAEFNIKKLSTESNGVFTYNEKLGAIIFTQKNEINLQFLKVLADNIEKLQLEMNLSCSSYFENNVLKMSFVGIIRPKE
jgi:hypothetical protein